MTEQQKYDMASVINSLGKIAFFNDHEKEAERLLKQNIAILEKMMEEGK